MLFDEERCNRIGFCVSVAFGYRKGLCESDSYTDKTGGRERVCFETYGWIGDYDEMIIRVRVVPGSKTFSWERETEGYVAHLTERAEGGKANKELINFLAKEFDVDWRKIRIKNPRSRVKLVEIVR